MPTDRHRGSLRSTGTGGSLLPYSSFQTRTAEREGRGGLTRQNRAGRCRPPPAARQLSPTPATTSVCTDLCRFGTAGCSPQYQAATPPALPLLPEIAAASRGRARNHPCCVRLGVGRRGRQAGQVSLWGQGLQAAVQHRSMPPPQSHIARQHTIGPPVPAGRTECPLASPHSHQCTTHLRPAARMSPVLCPAAAAPCIP